MLRIVLFCHVEAGTYRGQEMVFHPRHEEGFVVALPRIVDFADRHQVAIAFAMTPAALKGSETDLSGHEVGVHLHPQDTVLRRMLHSTIDLSSDCLAAYSAEDQVTLIETAKELFEDSEGQSPRTFVAGRWSENTTTMKLLYDAGFCYDGSPLPGHISDCADWTRIPRLAQPYAPSVEDYQRRGSVNLLYIPVYQGLWNHYLTPENIHLLGISYFKAALKEALIGGGEVVHMFFHSPMAMDPFFLSEFGAVIDFAQDELDAQFVFPSSLQPSDSTTSRPFPPAYVAYLNWRIVKGLIGGGELGRRLIGARTSLKESADTSLGAEQEDAD